MASITRKPCAVKPTKDSNESRNVVVEINWAGANEETIRALAAKDIVIRVQAQLRKKWAQVKPGMVHKVNAVDFAAGDPMGVINSMSKEDRVAFFKANGWIE